MRASCSRKSASAVAGSSTHPKNSANVWGSPSAPPSESSADPSSLSPVSWFDLAVVVSVPSSDSPPLPPHAASTKPRTTNQIPVRVFMLPRRRRLARGSASRLSLIPPPYARIASEVPLTPTAPICKFTELTYAEPHGSPSPEDQSRRRTSVELARGPPDDRRPRDH